MAYKTDTSVYNSYGEKITLENMSVQEVKRYLRMWDQYVRSQTFGDVVKIMNGDSNIA